jgi:hypothetical protein
MTTDEFLQFLQHGVYVVFDYFGKFLNSTFVISFIGALAGAYAGATSAQKVIERSRGREELLRELRSTNAAIMVSFTICNTVLGIKKQLVRPLYEKFLQDRAAFRGFLEKKGAGQLQDNAPFRFTADLQGFAAPSLPTETLKQLVFDKISAYGKPLSLVSLVENAALGLTTSILKRDKHIERFTEHKLPQDVWPLHYFGEKLPSGHTHKEYSDLVEVIHSYTDDLIFFSSQLCAELVEHGRGKRKLFENQFGKGAPPVNAPDFSGPRSAGLFPPESEYNAWRGWVIERSPDRDAIEEE